MQIGYTKMNIKGTLWVTVVCLLIFPIRSLSQDNIQLARADSLYRLGRIEYNEERYESAISYFEQAIEAGMNSESSSALIASGLTYTGQCYEELEDYDRALDFFQRGADIWKKVYGEDSFNYVVTLYDIGRCYGELQNYKDAIHLWSLSENKSWGDNKKGAILFSSDDEMYQLGSNISDVPGLKDYLTSDDDSGTNTTIGDYLKAIRDNMKGLN